MACPIKNSWRSMISRCKNPNHIHFKYYGGRNIKVCDRWLVFELFYEDMESTWFPGATIDRIDNDGDYTLENCQWLSLKDNVKKANQKRINDKTHNWLGGDASRKANQIQIDRGTHPRFDSKKQSELGKRSIQKLKERGIKPFEGQNEKRILEGNHNLVGKIRCLDIDVGKMVLIDKSLYFQNKNIRYFHFNSSVAKTFVKGERNGK